MQAPEPKHRFCAPHLPKDACWQTEHDADTDASWLKVASCQTEPIHIEVAETAAAPRLKPRIGGGYVLPIATVPRRLHAEFTIAGLGAEPQKLDAGDFIEVSDDPPPGPPIGGTEYGFGETSIRTNRYSYAGFGNHAQNGGLEVVLGEARSTKPTAVSGQRVFRVLRPAPTFAMERGRAPSRH